MGTRRALPGPMPARYYTSFKMRCSWVKTPPTEVPAPYREHWTMSYKGRDVGELFLGKSGLWFGVIFGRATIRGRDVDHLALHMAGLVINRSN